MLILLIFGVGFCRELYVESALSFVTPSGGMGAAMSPHVQSYAKTCGSGFFHAVALAFDFDQVGAMQEAIQNGCGSGDIADEFAPFFQRSVGGHQGRAQLIAAQDNLEEILAGFGREFFDAHVVDDQQIAS